MGFLDTIGSIASLIPGPIGSIAGGVTGLLGGSKNRRKEDALLDLQRQIAENQARVYQQYTQPAIGDLARTAGYTTGADSVVVDNSGPYPRLVVRPGTATFDPNYNPNAASAGQFFDPKNLESQMVGYREAGDRSYDSAVNAAQAASMGRGFIGRDSLRDRNVANIRREQAADTARFDRGLLTDLDNQRRAYLMEGFDKRDAARNQLIGIGSGSGGSAFGQLDSLGNIYASRAGNAAAGTGQLAQTAAMGDFNLGGGLNSAIDWIKRQTRRGTYRNPGYNISQQET